MKKFIKSLGFAMILSAVLAGSSFAYVLGESDATSRFTDANNNGVWSVGMFDGSSYSPYTYMEIPSLGLYGWNTNGDNDSHGNFLKNVTATTYNGTNSPLSSYWKSGGIILGSSPIISEYLYATFTAPSDGNYAIDFEGFARCLQGNAPGTSAVIYWAEGQPTSTDDLVLAGVATGYVDSDGNYVGDHNEVSIVKTLAMSAGDTFTVYINNDGANANENLGITFTAERQRDTVYYVDGTNGNDANDGTSPAKAWKTLDYAGNNSILTAGDTVLVQPGTYKTTQRGGVFLRVSGVTYKANGDVKLTSDFTPQSFPGQWFWGFQILADDVTVDGFEIYGIMGCIDMDGAQNVTVKNCVLHDTVVKTDGGFPPSAGVYLEGKAWATVDSCTIYNIPANGGEASGIFNMAAYS